MTFPRIDQVPYLVIDTETTGLHFWKDRVFGISITLPDKSTYYWDVRETPGAIPWLQDVIQSGAVGKWVGHHLKFDYHMLRESGVVLPPDRIDCTMIRAALLNEHEPTYELDFLARKYAGIAKDSEIYPELAALFGGRPTRSAQMPNLHRAPSSIVGRYAKQDTLATQALYLAQEAMGMADLAQVHSLELQLLPILIEMEEYGLRVDVERAEQAVRDITKRAEDTQQDLNRMAGFEVNPNPSGSIAKLFQPKKDEEGLWRLVDGTIAESTEGGKPSINADCLRRMRHPAAKMILDLRKMLKTRDTFLSGHILGHQEDGLIHCNFNQTKNDAEAGTGCMTSDTLIQTNRGWVPVIDVRVGDLVLDHNGEPQPVMDWFDNGVHRIYEVTTERGHVIKVTGNHPFLVGDKWVRADALSAGDGLLVYGNPEEWRPINGWPYEVSSWGRVRSAGKGGVSALRTKNPGRGRRAYGYLSASIKRANQSRADGNKKDMMVHRLMAMAWGLGGDVVQHLDGIPWDNNIQNLVGSSQKENNHTGADQGSYRHSAKLSEEQAERIKALKESGRSQSNVAREFGVCREMVRDIWNGKKWRRSEYKKKAAVYASDRVAQVRILPEERTYGIEVGGTHTHLTAGIVTHNTGRLSITAPALQQIPSRDKAIKSIVRPIFLPDEGAQWLGMDWSQFEFRVANHYGQVPAILDAYRKDPNLDFHQLVSDMTGIPRNAQYAGGPSSKAINLGLAFNMGSGRLAQECGLPFTEEKGPSGNVYLKAGPEAMAIFEKYHSANPGMKDMAGKASAIAKQRGFVRSIMGRRLRFPGGQFVHKASGLIYQATSADCMKQQLILLHRYLKETDAGRLLLSVHDEVGISLEKGADPEPIAKLYTTFDGVVNPIKLRVPITCDWGVGANWMEAKD